MQIARETGELAAKARDGKLGPAEMSGGCFSISSLGGIGGTSFTPIVNAPEVAILGVSKSAMQPVWDGQAFQPRLMLPLSLSLRPPRDRRRRGRALHRVPGAAARRHAARAAVRARHASALLRALALLRPAAGCRCWRAQDDECRLDLGRGWPPATENYGSAVEQSVRWRCPAGADPDPPADLRRRERLAADSRRRRGRLDPALQPGRRARVQLEWRQPAVAHRPAARRAEVPMPAALARRVVADWRAALAALVPEETAASVPRSRRLAVRRRRPARQRHRSPAAARPS